VTWQGEEIVIARSSLRRLAPFVGYAHLAVGDHKDPFDRMLIAQAQAEGLTIVSNARPFDAYGVERVW